MSQSSKKNVIAKNTIILYVKLIISTFVGIFSSRFVLQALGASDYGLYSIVGGIVVIMNFMGSVMNSVSYRFISVEIGKGEKGDPNRIYNTVQVIHICLAVGLLIIGEIVGTWYINNYLNISFNKIPDALFVLHFSILSSVATILAVPSNGLLVSVENFSFKAVIEIIYSILKLLLAISLLHYGGNSLRAYSVCIFVISLIIPISNIIFCKIRYNSISHWKFNGNIADYKQIASFFGWTSLGVGSTMVQDQGIALSINWFFTTSVNAALGLSQTVLNYIRLFVSSIGTAAVPQIMQNYSSGNKSDSLHLTFLISKYSCLLVMFPVVPALLFIDFLLNLWLGQVPDYTREFTICIIISNFFWWVSVGFESAIQASGNIKKYQIGSSIILISSFPVSVFLYMQGLAPYSIFIYLIFSNFLLLLWKTYILYEQRSFNMKEYYNVTLKPIFRVMLFIVPLFLIKYFFPINNNVLLNLFLIVLCLLYLCVIIFFIGFSKSERSSIKTLYKSYSKCHL